MPMFGYARVSTRDQDFNAQVAELLVVCRLDRLARSTRDLLNIIEALTQRGADSSR